MSDEWKAEAVFVATAGRLRWGEVRVRRADGIPVGDEGGGQHLQRMVRVVDIDELGRAAVRDGGFRGELPGFDNADIERWVASDDAGLANPDRAAAHVTELDKFSVHPAEPWVEASFADFDRFDGERAGRTSRDEAGRNGQGEYEEGGSGSDYSQHKGSLAKWDVPGTVKDGAPLKPWGLVASEMEVQRFAPLRKGLL